MISRYIDKIKELLNSPRGKNMLIFSVFLLIATVLWFVQVLNDETQREMRCPVRIVNIPDSVTRVTPMPEAMNISVRARGTQLVKYVWTHDPEMDIDYRLYKSGNKIQFNEQSMRAFFRNMIGGGAQVLSVTPDSLAVYFTTNPGVELPIKVDAHVVPGPQFAIIGKVHSQIDSVMVYSIEGLPKNLKSIPTQPITLNDVKTSQTLRVPLRVPAGMRAIPDSVDVRIEVEPLVSKTRKVSITTKNVPAGTRLIAVPSQVEVYYMVPMSLYMKSESNPQFTVAVDYNDIQPTTNKLPVNLIKAPKDFINVFVSVDSAEYLIER